MNNSVTIVGNLTRDAEHKNAAGTSLTKLRVATNERTNKNGVWSDGDSTYIDVSAWRSLGNSAASLKKGDAVIVVGKLKGRAFKYADGRDGYGYEIDATSIGKTLEKVDAPQKAIIVPDDENPWDEE